MKLRLDENLGLRWVARLRNAGHDADTVHDENLSGADDRAVMIGEEAVHGLLLLGRADRHPGPAGGDVVPGPVGDLADGRG